MLATHQGYSKRKTDNWEDRQSGRKRAALSMCGYSDGQICAYISLYGTLKVKLLLQILSSHGDGYVMILW